MEGLKQKYPAQVRGPAGETGACERRFVFSLCCFPRLWLI